MENLRETHQMPMAEPEVQKGETVENTLLGVPEQYAHYFETDEKEEERRRAREALEEQLKMMEERQKVLTQEFYEEVEKSMQEKREANPVYQAYKSCLLPLKVLVGLGLELVQAGVISGAAGLAVWELMGWIEGGEFPQQDAGARIIASAFPVVITFFTWLCYRAHRFEQKRAKKRAERRERRKIRNKIINSYSTPQNINKPNETA